MPEPSLDPDQSRVVEHDGGPLLVLGSPGTGKSLVLVERWLRLAAASEPHRVLLLVTSRRRALELRDSLPFRLPHRAAIDIPVHTWHALAYHLVTRYYRRLGYPCPPSPLNSSEQWSTVRSMLKVEDPARWGRYGVHLESDALTSEVADFCLRAGYRGVTDDELRALVSQGGGDAPVADFCLRYRRCLREAARLDYPELVRATVRLLEEDSEIADTVRRRFPHVLVDDVHDLAPAQLTLLSQLNTEHLVCAGDPDSAIEAFRGADPRWLEHMNAVTKDWEVVILRTVHRHGESVGRPALRLLEAGGPAPHRACSFLGAEGTACVRRFATMAAEIEAAAREVRAAHLASGVPYKHMAILVAQPSLYAHALQRVLAALDVPHHLDSADRVLFDEPSVRAFLDLARAALDQEPDDDLVSSVLGSVFIGQSPFEIRELQRAAFQRGVPLRELAEDVDEYRTLCTALRAAREERAYDALARVFRISRYCAELVERRFKDDGAQHELDALKALARVLTRFVERHSSERATLAEFLDSLAPGLAEPWTPEERAEGVHILSFHAAKGREWDVVCVLGVAEGLIPRARRAQGLFDPWALEGGTALDRAQAKLAEERRTLYVALTRARQRLVVSCSPGAGRATPSRFLEEVFGPLPDPEPADGDLAPLTLTEAAARLRRTLALASAPPAEKVAAAAALARIPGIDPNGWWWCRDYTPGPPLAREGVLVTSYSRIGVYRDCPLRYVLESVLGLDPESTYQMKFGSLIHRIFEAVDRGKIASLDEAMAAYDEEFKTHHRDYPNRPFAITYWQSGRDMIRRWWRLERQRGEVVATEYAFDDLEVDGHTIRGRIDRVTKQARGIVLTDYKTSRSIASRDEARESLQLAIYYLAAKVRSDLRRHGPPVAMELVYPAYENTSPDGGGECARRTQTPEEAELALEKLRSCLAGAAAEAFDPSPEADCRWCRMKILCPRWPEGGEVPP